MKQTSTKQLKHLEAIRNTQTSNVKNRLLKAFRELLQAKQTPTRYKLHKKTNAAYVTINKYFAEISNNFDEVVING